MVNHRRILFLPSFLCNYLASVTRRNQQTRIPWCFTVCAFILTYICFTCVDWDFVDILWIKIFQFEICEMVVLDLDTTIDYCKLPSLSTKSSNWRRFSISRSNVKHFQHHLCVLQLLLNISAIRPISQQDDHHPMFNTLSASHYLPYNRSFRLSNLKLVFNLFSDNLNTLLNWPSSFHLDCFQLGRLVGHQKDDQWV